MHIVSDADRAAMAEWDKRVAPKAGNVSPFPVNSNDDHDPLADGIERERLRREILRTVDAEEFDAARGPRPKRTLREYAKVEQPKAIIDRILAAEVNLLGGPQAEGKSMLARDWSIAIATGGDWRGYRAAPRNVLYVAGEGMHDVQTRWVDHPDYEKAADNIYILDEPINLGSTADTDSIISEYAEECPGLVIFDLVYHMGMTDDNNLKDVLPVIGNMKRISAAFGGGTLAQGHPPLNGQRRFRGSGAWGQLAAVEWHAADSRLNCVKSKIANAGALDMMYTAEYPALRWHTPGEQVNAEETRDRIVRAVLADNPTEAQRVQAQIIAAKLGISETTAKRLIRKSGS